jgi:predicted Rossmann fold nucleotide-binding protein DprA/Smf involved in DNA uptake
MTELAASVLDLVEQAPRTTDGVLAATGVGLGELGAALSELEARGLLVRRGGWIEAGGSGS